MILLYRKQICGSSLCHTAGVYLLHWVKDPNLFLAQETHNTSLVELRVRFSSQRVAASICLLVFNHYTTAVDSVFSSVEIYGKKTVSILVSVAEQNDS